VGKKNKFWIILSIVSILSAALFMQLNKPKYLRIVGVKELTLESGQLFDDPGVELVNPKMTGVTVTVAGSLQTRVPGVYDVTYILSDGHRIIDEIVRKVVVKDTTAPDLELKGSADTIVCPNQLYVEEGFTAIDITDGDVSSTVAVKNETAQISYTVADRIGNSVTKVRTLRYEDTSAPIITLNGPAVISLTSFSTYNDAGATATDNCGTIPTESITVSSNVDTSKVGSYSVTYSTTDSAGNRSEAKRTVNITAPPAPNVSHSGSVIYLTFDDGPSSNTVDVLRILREEGVKATFFVNHRDVGYNYLIKQAYAEGHTIGLHGYVHNYQYIYSSEAVFFDNLYKIQAEVESLTGYKSYLFRFPGGGSNTVSRFNPGIMTRLSIQLKEQGFHYFDWNVSSGDASNLGSAALVANVKRQLGSGKQYVVLMHDGAGHAATVGALRDIIRYGKSMGYTFSAIDMNTPESHHHIAN